MAKNFWLDWRFWITVLLSIVFLVVNCFLLFFAYVFNARHNHFGFHHRKSKLTLASVGFASLYLINRVYAIWLVYFDVFSIENKDEIPRSDRIMLLIYEVLNSLPVFGMGLCVSARVWLIFYDVNLAIRSGDEQWMDLISKWNIDMDNLHTLSASQRASSLIGKLIALPQFIKKTSSNHSLSRKRNMSPRQGSDKKSPRKSPKKGHSTGNSVGPALSSLAKIAESAEMRESVQSESSPPDALIEVVVPDGFGGQKTPIELRDLDSNEEKQIKKQNSGANDFDLKINVDSVDKKEETVDERKEEERKDNNTNNKEKGKTVPDDAPAIIRKQSSFSSEAYSKSKNDWFFSHKQNWGNVYWVLYRLVLPMLVIFMTVVVILSALRMYTLIPLVYAIWLLCCAIYGFTLYSFFPQFHDHLLLYSELALISWFSAAVGAVVMVFSILLLTDTTKESQFLFSVVRSTFNVFCFFTVHAFQTLWVIHQFQQNSAHLNNPDIYSGASMHKSPSVHGGNGSSHMFDNNSRRVTDLYQGETSLRPITEIQQKNTVCYYFLCCVDLTVDKIHNTGHKFSEVRRTMSMRNNSTTESFDIGGMLGRQSTTDASGAASPVSNDGRRKSNRTSMDRLLRRVLADETGFRLFMAHLFREFSYENLLAVIEFVQFSKQMMVEEGLLDSIKHQTVFPLTVDDIITFAKMANDEDEDELPLVGTAGEKVMTPTLTLTASRDNRYNKHSKKLNVNSLVQSLVSFPHYVECTRSSIVFDKRMIKEEKFLALFDKYVSNSSDLAINIDFRTRKPLNLLANEIRKWNSERQYYKNNNDPDSKMSEDDDFDLDAVYDLGSEVNHSTFDGCIRQLMILMRDSFSRFQRTKVYSKLRSEQPQLFNFSM